MFSSTNGFDNVKAPVPVMAATAVAAVAALDLKSGLSIPLGIFIGLLASFVQSLGLTIQRKSHVIDQSLPEHRRTKEYFRPLWLLGFAIFISSNLIGSLVQIASLPVVILAPLGAVSLLWNAFFARLILGDRFSPWMILGTILIAGGAILIAVFGIVPEPTRSLDDLLELFKRPAFAAYFSTLAFIVVVCLAITHVAEYALSRREAELSAQDEEDDLILTPNHTDIIDLTQAPSSTHTPSATENDDSHLPTERTPLLSDRKAPSNFSSASTSDAVVHSLNRTRLVIAISYASFSGILSGMCLIFAKSGVELLLLTIGGKNQFYRWETWVLLLGLVVFALLQLWYLHKALILADPTLVCPSAFCFYNLSSIVNGLVYFDQLSLIRPLHLGLVVLGIVVLLGGVWVVSIQSGGGGVDIGPWAEEQELVGPDGAFCDEPEETDDLHLLDRTREGDLESCAISNAEDGSQDVPVTATRKSVRLAPVPMDRETRSESSVIQNLSSAQERARYSLPELPSPSPHAQVLERQAEQEGRPRRRNSLLSNSTDSRRPRLQPAQSAHAVLPVSPTYYTRYALRHRATMHDACGGQRTSPYTQSVVPNTPGSSSTFTIPGHGPLSPPLNAVSTLGSGFQIGLSPVSPGFTIMPKLRKARLGGLGRASGLVSLNAGGDEGMGGERRRTVSEGDVNRVLRGYEPVGDDVEGCDAEREIGQAAGEEREPLISRTDGEQPRRQSGMWGWVRRWVSQGKDSE